MGYLHYGDSNLIQRIRWLPFIEISVVALFIFVGFIGFNSIKNNEKRNIWVGMARETAHQLGTPVSALMGWLDRIKNHPNETDAVLDEMQSDLNRLKQISDRFSKMSSNSDLEKISIYRVLQDDLFFGQSAADNTAYYTSYFTEEEIASGVVTYEEAYRLAKNRELNFPEVRPFDVGSDKTKGQKRIITAGSTNSKYLNPTTGLRGSSSNYVYAPLRPGNVSANAGGGHTITYTNVNIGTGGIYGSDKSYSYFINFLY